VHDVLVDHDALQHTAVRHVAAGNLLHLCVALDVDLLATHVLSGDRRDRVERQTNQHVGEACNELRAGARLDQVGQTRLVIEVERYRELIERLHRVVKRLEVSVAHHRGVDIPLEEWLRLGEVFTGEDDDRRGPVSNLLLLSTGKLNHGLRRRMGHVHLT